MKKWLPLFTTVALLAGVSAGRAAILPPGSFGVSVDPINLGTITSGTLIADTGVITAVTSSFTAHMRTQVYKDPLTGFYDFVYSIKNDANSEDAIHRLTMRSYSKAPFADVYYALSSDVAPTTADRSPSGATIGFNFPLGSADIMPGDSVTVVIRTKVKAYQRGLFSAIDGTTATVDSFAPAPLPSSVVLFGTGALGLCGGWFRRLRKIRPLLA